MIIILSRGAKSQKYYVKALSSRQRASLVLVNGDAGVSLSTD